MPASVRLAGAVAAFAVCTVVRAQAPHSAEVQLATARTTYERAVEAVRGRVLDAIKKIPDVELRQDQRRAFRDQGVWPPSATVAEIDAMRKDADDAFATLAAAYKKCMADLDEIEALAERIRGESDQWKRVNDMVAWRAVDLPKAAMPAENAGAPATSVLPVELPDAFRLEIEGVAKAGEPVWLLVPTAGKPTVVALHADGGRFHALVTFAADGVLAADLGVARAAGVQPEAPTIGRSPALRGVDCRVERVRWKEAPSDSQRAAREAALAALERDASAKDAREKADKEIALLEKKRKEPARKRQAAEKELKKCEKALADLEALIARERARGNDVSGLLDNRHDCTRALGKARKAFDDAAKEVDELDARIAVLRQPVPSTPPVQGR